MALFGMTAGQWRENNLNKTGNIRDYATIEQLIVLTNLESINAMWISQNVEASDRLQNLNDLAISQMRSLVGNEKIKGLEKK